MKVELGGPPWIANTGTCPAFDDDYRFQLRFANGDEFDGDAAAEDYDWRLDLPPSGKITHWRTWEPSKQASVGTYTVFSTGDQACAEPIAVRGRWCASESGNENQTQGLCSSGVGLE